MNVSKINHKPHYKSQQKSIITWVSTQFMNNSCKYCMEKPGCKDNNWAMRLLDKNNFLFGHKYNLYSEFRSFLKEIKRRNVLREKGNFL